VKGYILPIVDLYSKRQRKLRGEFSDVYTYDSFPQPFRVQTVHILTEVLGTPREHGIEVYKIYEFIVDTLCREYGVFRLPGSTFYDDNDHYKQLSEFIIQESDTEKVLDAVELSFRVVDRIARKLFCRERSNSAESADDAIAELNGRFKEHSIGFQYTDGEIIRVDSEFIHAEVVKPALALLHQEDYSGAQEEFLKAHEHYRHGNAKEALNECLKSFESVMKIICDKRGWSYDKNATSKSLIKVCLDNDLIPAFWQNHYSSLRNLLENGIPTGRNKLGGHGQGGSSTSVPDYLVSYMLHMTASALVFLIEAERSLP